MTTQTISLDQFITEQQLEMTVQSASFNPNMAEPMPRNFKCVLSKAHQAQQMSIYFSQGAAHTQPPTLHEVLDCLASDAIGVEQVSTFEEWAREYGYNTDSRKAERTWSVCLRQAQELRVLLGQIAFEQLLYNTERL